jgi:hypothetical protein
MIQDGLDIFPLYETKHLRHRQQTENTFVKEGTASQFPVSLGESPLRQTRGDVTLEAGRGDSPGCATSFLASTLRVCASHVRDLTL